MSIYMYTYNPDESNMSTYQRALNALYYEIGRNGLEYVDNIRIARTDDHRASQDYFNQVTQGCCGFFDTKVTIDGIKYLIGCNHSH